MITSNIPVLTETQTQKTTQATQNPQYYNSRSKGKILITEMHNNHLRNAMVSCLAEKTLAFLRSSAFTTDLNTIIESDTQLKALYAEFTKRGLA